MINAAEANDGPSVTVTAGSEARRSIVEMAGMYEPSMSPLSRPDVNVFSSGTPTKSIEATLAAPFQ